MTPYRGGAFTIGLITCCPPLYLSSSPSTTISIMLRLVACVSALIMLVLTTLVNCQAASGPPFPHPNMLITGDANRPTLEDPGFRKSWDGLKYSYYS